MVQRYLTNNLSSLMRASVQCWANWFAQKAGSQSCQQALTWHLGHSSFGLLGIDDSEDVGSPYCNVDFPKRTVSPQLSLSSALPIMEQHPSYGGQGPLILGVTWSFCIVTSTLAVLRTLSAARKPGSQRWWEFRWDYIWFILSYVRPNMKVSLKRAASDIYLGCNRSSPLLGRLPLQSAFSTGLEIMSKTSATTMVPWQHCTIGRQVGEAARSVEKQER